MLGGIVGVLRVLPHSDLENVQVYISTDMNNLQTTHKSVGPTDPSRVVHWEDVYFP